MYNLEKVKILKMEFRKVKLSQQVLVKKLSVKSQKVNLLSSKNHESKKSKLPQP